MFVALLFAGCQSGGQYDQAARELRMQEDELYALENYLEEYQRLVCKYRTENAALKRQLAANGVSPATSAPRTMNGAQPTPAGPDVDVAPPTNGTPPVIDEPDVPPLEGTSSHDYDPNIVRAAHVDDMTSPDVSDVWLHGEIVANEEGGGPRMVVEVDPLDAESRGVKFDGALSLMLMAPDDQGGKVNVARWDYRPSEVRAAVDPSGGSETIRFHLELPADTAATDARELWVRLLPRRGGKLLAHTEIDLLQPSLFSSKADVVPGDVLTTSGYADDAPVVAAVYEDVSDDEPAIEETSLTDVTPVSGEMFDGGWTIARPGHPAGLPKSDEDDSSEWRASLEPPPMVTADSAAARPKPRVSRPRESTETHDIAASKQPKPIEWSPDRLKGSSASSPRTAASRPSWSATR
jgi:hypothetical protein